jgi:hypothetical protein
MEDDHMKQWTLFLALTALLTACTVKESRKESDAGSGYTHSDNRSTQEGTGIQEDEMSAGDPQ